MSVYESTYKSLGHTRTVIVVVSENYEYNTHKKDVEL